MVVAVVLALMAGYPVALTLAGMSLGFAVFGHVDGAMNFAILGALPQRIFGVMTNDVLLAIPMFIFMGVMLERSRIAEDLLETHGAAVRLRCAAASAISVVLVGALLAASTGVVGATTVTIGLITLPAMLRYGYDPRLRPPAPWRRRRPWRRSFRPPTGAGAARRSAQQCLSGGAARAAAPSRRNVDLGDATSSPARSVPGLAAGRARISLFLVAMAVLLPASVRARFAGGAERAARWRSAA